jgi:hypothetical protein
MSTAHVQQEVFATPLILEPTELLSRFVRLEEGTDVQILDFAREFGRLRECTNPLHPSEDCRACSQRLPHQDFPDTWEPLSLWRLSSRALWSALGIWADLSEGNQPNPLECQALRLLVPSLIVGSRIDVENSSELLREFLSVLLYTEDLWLDALASERAFTSLLLGRGVRAALSLGLAVALTSGGLVRCDKCRIGYRARRRPRESQRKYGPERHYCSPKCQAEGENQRQRAAYKATNRKRSSSA